jgi:isopropylmalate/isohomocitrate dehydrogenase-like protein
MIRVCALPGDGIGPEVVKATIRVIDALDPGIEWAYGHIGFGAYEEFGLPLPQRTIELVEECDASLMGAVTTPTGIADYRSPVLGLRQKFDLFANVRPCISVSHALSRAGVDLTVVRENTECLYVGEEWVEDGGNTAIALRRITRFSSRRIIAHAFELARNRQGKMKVTVVHKANVLRETCGLFLATSSEVSKEYPDVAVEDMLVDRCAMELIRNPGQFDVIVTTNLFGDILSDEASMLVGGLGLACSANIGESCAVFEPVHGSAPDLAGQNIANPIATILSACLMLEYLGLSEYAQKVRDAVSWAIVSGNTTPDLGGQMGTSDVADSLIARIQA